MPQSLPNHLALHDDAQKAAHAAHKPSATKRWTRLFHKQVETAEAPELVEQSRLSDARFVVSVKGEVLECSSPSARYLGITETEVMEMGLLSWIHVQDRPLFLTQLSQSMQHGQRVEFSLRVRRQIEPGAMGAQMFTHVKARAVPILATGAEARWTRLQLVFWDNQTEADWAQRADDLRHELNEKNQQLANTQTGFADHIGSLLRMVDVIAQQDDADLRKQHSAQMVQYLARLQNNIAHQAHIETGSYQLDVRPTKVQILFDEAIVAADKNKHLAMLDVDMDMQLVRWFKQRFAHHGAAPAKLCRQGDYICLDVDARAHDSGAGSVLAPHPDFLKAEALAVEAGGRLVAHKKGDNSRFYRLHLPISAQNSAKVPAAPQKHQKEDAHLVTQWIGKPISRKSAAG